jgi:hypothetical protein
MQGQAPTVEQLEQIADELAADFTLPMAMAALDTLHTAALGLFPEDVVFAGGVVAARIRLQIQKHLEFVEQLQRWHLAPNTSPYVNGRTHNYMALEQIMDDIEYTREGIEKRRSILQHGYEIGFFPLMQYQR